MDYTIGLIKFNDDVKEYPLDSITISHCKDVNEETTFTEYLFKYYDQYNKLKEFSIKITPAIHVI